MKVADMKTYLAHAVHVYGGVFEDAIARWPKLRPTLEKDYSYLRSIVEKRGLPFLTVTLPSACKAFDRMLDTEMLVCQEFPQGFPHHANRPKFLRGLFDLVFDDSSTLRLDACTDAVFFIRQILSLCKKLRLDCGAIKTQGAINDFFEIEKHLPLPWPDTWDSDVPKWQSRFGHPHKGEEPFTKTDGTLLSGCGISSYDWSGFRRLCRYVVSGLGEPDWWSLRPKHGPGVVSESRREFDSKYEFPNWPERLDGVFPYDWFATGLLHPGYAPSSMELPSRLIAVPKDQRGPRIICSEPLAHQWIQQGIRRWLEKQMETSLLGRSIDFRNQEASRKAALDASLSDHSREGMVTIDLSSASDRLSTRLVEYCFQGSPILDGMHACRTRLLRQELLKDQDEISRLRKFSTMGSALTFPVQSIVYTLLSVFALRLTEGKQHSVDGLEESFDRVRVFGDDIILPKHAYETVKLVLYECGLKVNTAKSFGGTCFRESCGMDAFRGNDVTPAYILRPYDASPSTIDTTVAVVNNLFRKGLWAASDCVLSQVPEQEVKLLRIRGEQDGNFGLFSFCGTQTSHLRQGWCRDLHRTYSISLGLTSKVDRVRGRGSADLTQYFAEKPNPLVEWEAGQVIGARLRKGRVRVLD